AIGVAWLGIDSAPHALQVSLDVPDAVAPRQLVEIPVQVSGVVPGQTAHLTLAAVDEGVLQITDFASPDPLAHYFGKRRLGVEIRDLYGRLIDGREGRRGRIREGGDEAALAKRGAPPPTRLVALFSGIVTLDADGRARIRLDIPDYNGRLRLMAVAYDAAHVGSAEAPLVVRDELVTTLSMPRFMAPGDAAQLTLSLQNLSAPAGRFDVALTAEGGVSLGEGATAGVDLAAGASTLLHATLKGETPGPGRVALVVSGPDGYRLERSFDIFVRPAQLATVERVARRLAPGESLNLSSAVTGRFVPGTGEVLASFSTLPNLDVPGLLRQLDRYPYGCLEQTVSRALPLLYVGEVSRLWGAGGRDDDLKPRIQQAINRTLAMQRYDGSFGLWDSADPPEPWLSAYAMEFYTRARRLGYGVPEAAYARGLEWLKRHSESYYADSQDDLGSRAYALFVLAETQAGDASTLRYFHDNYARRLPTALAAAQLGAALALNGDEARAKEAFGIAQMKLERQRRDLRDYGSALRDLAATATLMIEARYTGQDPAPLLERAAAAQQEREWLSTQEEGWLLMAAAASVGESKAMTLAVNDTQQAERSEPLYLRPSAEELAAGLSVRNAGADTVWARATVIGVPRDPLPPVSRGYAIERKFYDVNGAEVDLGQVRQTDLLVVVITGRKQSELAQQTLVVDLLPPGFEVENAHLAGAQTTDQLGSWLPDLTPVAYSEFLDDRYVAALDLKADARDFTVAYIVRAVTPGTYTLPASTVESMYQPELRARTGTGTVTIRPY
ncbi:MAG: alpha-2-macroglobulin family protein, partial [Rhodospirillaceae bacterium]|nr:alpha-2-macroglobulin family protein [Rhodospirillaceae bacterium]